jgi:hypothetical protein
MKEIGTTSRGYTIFEEDNEVGGKRYWSDEIGGRVFIWDTSLIDVESLEFAIAYEKKTYEG